MSRTSLAPGPVVGVVLAAMLIALPTPAARADHVPTLGPGSSGPAVTCWQKKLRWVALARPATRVALITADGSYGPATTEATRAFQRAVGLSADGVAGHNTQLQMSSELGHAWQTARDEYAAALYFGPCTTREPMVCQPTRGYPYIRDNPHVADPTYIQYYANTRCTQLDAGLERQDASLYLTTTGDDQRGLVRAQGLRQTTITLGKSLVVGSGRYTAVHTLTVLGNVMYLSVPGCRRVESRRILCEWRSSAYSVA